MVTTRVLAQVDPSRLQKAVEGFVVGAYTIVPTAQTEAEICGFVTNGDGKEYGVVLTEAKAFCSCRDAMFRHAVCKHAVLLALHAIRNPQAEAKPVTEAEKEPLAPVNVKLAKVRAGWVFAA